MKKFLTLLLAVVLMMSLFLPALAAQSKEPIEYTPTKIRTIITTDGELDDLCSMVRCMLYLNTFELEALVSSSSRFHYLEKTSEVFKGRDSNQRWIDAYAKVYDNLCLHAEGFPTPEYMTSVNLEGNILRPGEMDTDTEGSLKIKECIMDDREDLLFLQVWGGTNTVAAALRSIEDEYKDAENWKDIYNKVCAKVQIWIDLDQDNTLNNYILPHWPNLRVIVSYDQFNAFAYNTRFYVPEEYWTYFDPEFMLEYIANDKNALAQMYYECLEAGLTNRIRINKGTPEWAFISEGDTPNFFYILDNGLRSWENPYFGGWAGRFQKVFAIQDTKPGGDMNLRANGTLLGGLFIETYDNGNRWLPMWRWFDDIQNDFAARMEWCHLPYDEANHEPVVQVAEGLDFTAQRGETVTFTVNTYDPDGDNVNLNIWQYYEADTYHGLVDLNVEGDTCSFVVPNDAVIGSTIHVIVEAEDEGHIPMTRYQRVIVTVVAPPAAE